MIYLLLYALTWHSPHYFAWIAPFMAWFVAKDRRMPWYYALLVICWTLFWFVASDKGVFTKYLFSPLNPEFVQARPGAELIRDMLAGLRFSPEQAVILARTGLATVGCWMSLIALRPTIHRALAV